MPSAQIHDIRIISNDEDGFCGWPTLARRKNGELLAVCSGGRVYHVCPYGQVIFKRSLDGGQSWLRRRVLADGPIDDRDAGVLETAAGTILVVWFTSLAWEQTTRKILAGEAESHIPAAELARWKTLHQGLTDSLRSKELGAWALRSEDGGQTWSSRIDTLVNSPHGPTQLRDGRLLYAGKRHGEGMMAANGSPFLPRLGVAESRDDGRSWQWLADIPSADGHKAIDYHELHAVEAADGTLLAQIRNHNELYKHETLQSESNDGGKTWSVAHPIGVWGFPSHLLALRDGRLLMTYGHRRDPRGNQARFSTDHGKSWSEPIILSGDGNSDLGYPSTVELETGELLTLWYERIGGAPNAALRLARWNLVD